MAENVIERLIISNFGKFSWQARLTYKILKKIYAKYKIKKQKKNASL
jgi:hypothetical protein